MYVYRCMYFRFVAGRVYIPVVCITKKKYEWAISGAHVLCVCCILVEHVVYLLVHIVKTIVYVSLCVLCVNRAFCCVAACCMRKREKKLCVFVFGCHQQNVYA